MPNYKSQLGHLLPLLAQLHQGSLSGIAVQKLRNPAQDTSIFVAEVPVQPIYRGRIDAHGVAAMPMHVGIIVRDDPVVVILLRHGSYCCSSLSLGMLLARVTWVLWWVVALLLVQP